MPPKKAAAVPKRSASRPSSGSRERSASIPSSGSRAAGRLREALEEGSRLSSTQKKVTRQNATATPDSGEPAAEHSDHPSGGYDTLVQGTVYTGCEEAWAECIAFNQSTGRIAFVGSVDELAKRTKEGSLQRFHSCHVMEAKGLVLPAFHDAHCHPFGAGNRLRQITEADSAEDDRLRDGSVDLSKCKTKKKVEQLLTSKAKERIDPKIGPTILGEACPADLYEVPDIAACLERVVPGRPLVLLVGSESDEVLVNETALTALPQLNSRWQYTPADPAIERGETGKPTGRFRNSFWATRFALLSPNSMASKGLRGLIRGILELSKHGIVTCTDAFVFMNRVPMYELAYMQDVANELPRTSLAIGFKADWSEEETNATLERACHLRQNWDESGHRFCIREAKVEVDNLAMWTSTFKRARPSWDLCKLDRVVEAMIAANYSMHLHVFGDLAVKHSLDSLSRAEASATPLDSSRLSCTEERRHKLAHVFEMLPEDEAAMSSSEGTSSCSVVAVFQPFWFSYKAWSSYEDAATQVHKRLVEHGAACYGSDWDISSLSPLQGVEAVLRRPGTLTAGTWHQRLAQAIRLYTLDAARAMWLESESGTLEFGKFADICILDTNIFDDAAAVVEDSECSDESPLGASVVATISRGALIFQQSERAEPEAESETPMPPVPPRPSRRAAEDEILRSTCSCGQIDCSGRSRRSRKRAGANKWCSIAFSGGSPLEVKT